MDAENLSFDNSTNTKVIEDLGTILPWVGITVLSNSFVIETIHGGDLSGLVVTSEEGDVGWILQLEAQQKLECFY